MNAIRWTIAAVCLACTVGAYALNLWAVASAWCMATAIWTTFAAEQSL